MHGAEVVFAGNAGEILADRNSPETNMVAFRFAQSQNPSRGRDSKVSWWRVECWNNLADKIRNTQYSHDGIDLSDSLRGARLLISGRIELKSFERDTGESAINPTLVADEIAFSTHFGPLDVRRKNR